MVLRSGEGPWELLSWFVPESDAVTQGCTMQFLELTASFHVTLLLPT
jgi:hypothetical protein